MEGPVDEGLGELAREEQWHGVKLILWTKCVLFIGVNFVGR